MSHAVPLIQIIFMGALFALIACNTSMASSTDDCVVHVNKIPGPADWAIAIHGGAGTIPRDVPKERLEAYAKSLTEALQLGETMLESGASALETVEAVIRVMEDNPLFNAGKGSVFTAVGTHELDASIMDGRDGRTGAVAAVRTIRHPISLARLVMTETRHVLLSGDGAEAFADEVDVERVENEYFDTDLRRASLDRFLRRKGSDEREPCGGSTVGCVVRDKAGDLAAATSTGGMTGKRWGRVGDSPIVGAGTWADLSVAVSCTGTGEEFIRHAVAHDIAARIEYAGASLEQSCRSVLGDVLQTNDGGLIAVGSDGSIVLAFNTTGMYRAAANSDGRQCMAIWDELMTSK